MHRGDFPPPHGPFRDNMLRPDSDHSDPMDPKRQRALRSVFSKELIPVKHNLCVVYKLVNVNIGVMC